MKKIILALSAITLLMYSCSNNQPQDAASTADTKDSLQKQLLGEWNYTSMKVKINTALNSDSTAYVDINEGNWEKELKTKAPKAVFNEDLTYYVEYKNLKDSIIRGAAGTWYVINDSLTMNQKQPDNTSFLYKVAINNGIAEFTGVVDWEGDGKVDDEYTGVLKK